MMLVKSDVGRVVVIKEERDTISSLGRREDGSVAGGPHDARKTVFLTITARAVQERPTTLALAL
jgi:hypothetical protein